MDFSPMERNQVEAALINQLDMLAQSERRMTPGTFEAECILDAIRYTGSALTKIQVDRYGIDEPDELVVVAPSDAWHLFLDR